MQALEDRDNEVFFHAHLSDRDVLAAGIIGSLAAGLENIRGGAERLK